ncbi:putative cytoplasmic protein [Klebsiella michiganensis]|nr:putative cytoplasmic protein [Klebsiella michiganensis]
MMNSENKGYSLAVINGNNKDKKKKCILSRWPCMSLISPPRPWLSLFPRCRWKTPEERIYIDGDQQ